MASFPPDESVDACAALNEAAHKPIMIGRASVGDGVRFNSGEPLQSLSRDEVARLMHHD